MGGPGHLLCSTKGMKRVNCVLSILSPFKSHIHTLQVQSLPAKQFNWRVAQRGFLTHLAIMANRPTLVPPPPINPSKSAIENVLELTELAAIAPVCI